MKWTTLAVLSGAAAANALSSCIINCQSSVAEEAGCGDNYETKACYCSSDFTDGVKACLYNENCDSDVSVFYDNVDDFCDGEQQETAQGGKGLTLDDVGGWLTQCGLDCQEQAGKDQCGSGNYNQTSCLCENADFATDVKACLYDNCDKFVGPWFDYREGECPNEPVAASRGANSDENEDEENLPNNSNDDNGGSSGLSSGTVAGICVGSILGGLLVGGAAVFLVMRKRKASRAAAHQDAEARHNQLMKESGGASYRS
ncbi:hypothetical protein MBLNU230_g7748t1 [Neophaeotheca triangularis]